MKSQNVEAIRRLLLSLLLIFALTLGLFTMRSQNASAPDYPYAQILSSTPEVIVEIPKGATGSEIAQILFEDGVVKSAASYFQTAVGDVRSQKVAPGSHRINLEISAKQALEQLLDPSRIPNLLKVFEGEWKSEVAQSLVDYGFSSSEVNKAFRLVNLPKGFRDVEGLLFPAQYTFEKSTSAQEVIQEMINRFTTDEVAQQILASKGPFTPLEMLTIASIIQAEGETKAFTKVSRVIFNRLEKGMPLQMDATVHYVQKSRGNIFLSTRSTLIKSAYNTYRNRGLPPGPIGNPGSEAMSASLNPADGDWLYFITVAPEDTRFTASFDQFNEWKALYTKNRKAGLFK
jgi:UPF0755 protein